MNSFDVFYFDAESYQDALDAPTRARFEKCSASDLSSFYRSDSDTCEEKSDKKLDEEFKDHSETEARKNRKKKKPKNSKREEVSIMVIKKY